MHILESTFPILEQYIEASLDQIRRKAGREPFISFFQETMALAVQDVFSKINESLYTIDDIITIRCIESYKCQSESSTASLAYLDDQDAHRGLTLNICNSAFETVSLSLLTLPTWY